MKIGILNPGKMGVAVAQTMVNSGQDVYWISAGRSDATRQRAESAGLRELTSGAAMVETVEAIVCVCPPHAAVDVAEMVVAAGFKGIYVDANAIAPRTTHQIKEIMTPAGIDFVDGGIIGMPPTEPNTSWLYLSGTSAEFVSDWFSAGPLEVQVINDQIGAASAMKMCYAANTKGTNALVTSVMAAADEMGVLSHLEEMWERHFPGFAAQRQRAAVSVAYNKAWRFAGEMDEIARTWADAGVPNGFYTAAGELYRRTGHLREAEGEQTLDEVLKAVRQTDQNTDKEAGMFHTFRLGNHNCLSLSDFARTRTVKQTFPRIDPAELEKEIALGGYDLTLDTEMELHGNVLLIDTGDQKIMIDAGLPAAGGNLVQSLQAAGIGADEIDLILVTHGDGDHIGGLASYPNAKIVMPTSSYKLWIEDTNGMVEEFVKLFRDSVPADELETMANGRAKYAEVILDMGDRVVMVEMGEEIAPGITFAPAPGHRRDHTAVVIESAGEMLLHVADAWRHPLQLKRQDFYCLFDSYPDILAETMVKLLDQAAETNALVFGAHFNFPALIRIGKENGVYEWIEVQ